MTASAGELMSIYRALLRYGESFWSEYKHRAARSLMHEGGGL